jgi:hypothetical protein
MNDTPTKRRWFRFSLRTLFVLVTVLGIWLGIQVDAARRQKEAVTAILKSGGTIWFDYQIRMTTPSGGWGQSDAPPPGPAWLRKLVGDDYFRTAKVAGIGDTTGEATIAESDFAQVAQLPELEILAIDNVQICGKKSGVIRPIHDDDFVVLERLTKIGCLELTFARSGSFTDNGLKHIQHLSRLDQLNLTNCDVTDAGLQYLKGLTKLKKLLLVGTQVTDDGIRDLKKSLPTLKIWYGRSIEEINASENTPNQSN